MKPDSHTVYHFEVTLEEVDPRIWREIQVPNDYSFGDLHVAIQDSMGWLDYHLNEFEINNPGTGDMQRIGIPDDEMLEDQPTLAGWEMAISDYFSADNPSASYTYDFGDNWRHIVTLKGIVERSPGRPYPQCVAGERACPPEDCGGPWNYEEFLEAIRDPGHEEHERMLEWVGEGFHPEVFNAEGVHFEDPGERWKIAFERE